jgi:hypothetical protein
MLILELLGILVNNWRVRLQICQFILNLTLWIKKLPLIFHLSHGYQVRKKKGIILRVIVMQFP